MASSPTRMHTLHYSTPHPLLFQHSEADDYEPDGISQPLKNRALILIWHRETSLAERAWIHQLCIQGDVDCAKSWLFSDCAISDVYGLCPQNAPGRVWDRLARCSGLRQVFDSKGRDIDDRCLSKVKMVGSHLFFPSERRMRLLSALWTQAKEDFKEAQVDFLPSSKLSWPPPAPLLETWLKACRDRADMAREDLMLLSAIETHECLASYQCPAIPL